LQSRYNINSTAESRLGSQHSEETRALISKVTSGENNPMFGKLIHLRR